MACLAAGCGRVGFDPLGAAGRVDGGTPDGTGGGGTPDGTGSSGTPDATVNVGTFGSTQVGISTQNSGADRVWLSKFTLPEAAQVQRIVAHLAPGSSTSSVRGVIYADAAGTPSTLVGTTGSVVVANTSAPDWVPLPFAAPVSLAPGTYWLGTHTMFQLGIAYQSAAGASKFNNDIFSDGPDATYAGGAQTFTLELSIYAEYTR
jgi:hypothetical protein